MPDAPPPASRVMQVPQPLVPAVERMIAEFNGDAPISGQLEYATPYAQPRPIIHIPLAVALFILASVFTYLMVAVVPRMKDLYKDFGARLPTATQWVLDISEFIAGRYGWTIVWALAIAAPFAAARLRPWPPRNRAVSWGFSIYVLILLLGLSLLLIYIMLELPIFSLMQAINGKL